MSMSEAHHGCKARSHRNALRGELARDRVLQVGQLRLVFRRALLELLVPRGG